MWKITTLTGLMALRNSLGICTFEYAPLGWTWQSVSLDTVPWNISERKVSVSSELLCFYNYFWVSLRLPCLPLHTRTGFTITSISATTPATPTTLIPTSSNFGEMLPMLPFHNSLAILYFLPAFHMYHILTEEEIFVDLYSAVTNRIRSEFLCWHDKTSRTIKHDVNASFGFQLDFLICPKP